MHESIDLDTRKHCSGESNSLLFNLYRRGQAFQPSIFVNNKADASLMIHHFQLLEDNDELLGLFKLSSILRMLCF